jgi:dihydrodipicolinate synthase/N-acetylneuraminate lyase
VRTFSVRGLICPLVTPMDRQGRLDLPATIDLIEFLVQHNVSGAFVAGTTGEGLLLSLVERKELAECVIDAVRGRIAVIVHAGCSNTGDSVELARHALSCGADAIAAITPYFFSYSDGEILAHYLALAGAVPELPLLLYCFPANARNDISPELFGRLQGEAPSIVGIKYSGSQIDRLQGYVDAAHPGSHVYSGDDGLMLQALRLGASGPVSGCSVPFPEPFRELYSAYVAGDVAASERWQLLVRSLAGVLGYGRPAYLKAALEMRGLRAGPVRPPLAELSLPERMQLKAQLQELGML